MWRTSVTGSSTGWTCFRKIDWSISIRFYEETVLCQTLFRARVQYGSLSTTSDCTKAGESPTCRGSAHGCTRLQAGCFPYFPSPTKNASIARLQNLLLGRPLSRATCVHRRKRRKSRYARTLLLGRKQGAETPSLSAGCRHHECSSYIEIPANSASCLPVPGMRALHAKYSDIGTPQLFRTPTKSRNARRCLNHRSSVGDCVPETAADLPVGKYATCSSRFRGHRQRSEDLPTHNS